MAKQEKTTRITNQRRVGGTRAVMSYDLKCDDMNLGLVITPRSNDGDLGEWHIEAKVKRAAGEPFSAGEWADTRTEALRAVGRSWNSNFRAQGLLPVDWDAVAQALDEVRAL
jgi:hypothetical protein